MIVCLESVWRVFGESHEGSAPQGSLWIGIERDPFLSFSLSLLPLLLLLSFSPSLPHTTHYPTLKSLPTQEGNLFHSPSFSPPPKLFVLHHRISDVVFLTVDSFPMSAQWIVRPPLLIPWFHREWIGPSLMVGGGSISMEREE